MERANRKFLTGFVAGLALIPVAALLYLRLGLAPVATAAPPLPLEKAITHMAMNARINREAPRSSPIPLTDSALVEGAEAYREYCSGCHGLPHRQPTETSLTMFPPPPQFFAGSGVTHDSAFETYWKIKNGIRLTGMPAYGENVSENDLWKISLLLSHADRLPPSATVVLSQ